MRGTLTMNETLHIEILTEDRSGGTVIRSLIEKSVKEMIDTSIITYLRPHKGKGYILPQEKAIPPPKFSSGLLDLLPAKLAAYDSVYAGRPFVLVVVMDSDNIPPAEVYRNIEKMCQVYAPSLSYVIGICVEEIESWMLADKAALIKAYPQIDEKVINEYSQDSICGTWEVLARAILSQKANRLIRVGYPAVGIYKHEWAQKVAPFMEPGQNRSPSFIRFYKMLKKTVCDIAYE